MLKYELNYHDRFDKMRSITKTRNNNNVTNDTSVISIEYDIELSRSMRQCVVYNEDPIRQ